MEYRGSSAYNDALFFKHYLARRNREESPNNIIEKPVILDMVGDINGKRILDLGCGDAGIGVDLLRQGGLTYDGVEGSVNMAREAQKNLIGTTGSVHLSSIEDWTFKPEQYDLVISRLALHYLCNLQSVIDGVYQTLTNKGRFIFSVQHPILTSSSKSAESDSPRQDWIVDDYFIMGKRLEPWIDKKVVKYHRTTEEYFQILKKAGFMVNDIREGTPRKGYFRSDNEFIRRSRIPLFLIFSCVK